MSADKQKYCETFIFAFSDRGKEILRAVREFNRIFELRRIENQPITIWQKRPGAINDR